LAEAIDRRKAMDLNLHEKVVVVTGADSGIGAEILRLALESGARVVGVDIDPNMAVSAAARLGERAHRARFVVGDVALEGTHAEYVRTAIDTFGRLDVMINNAAIGSSKRIHEATPSEWDRILDVNLKSLYWSARVVVPLMKRQGGGLILNTASISSVAGIPQQGVYAATKGAVAQLTRQMAIEYAPDNIRVNAICPGTVDTPLLRKAAVESGNPEGFLKMLADMHPIGRIAAAEEIAALFIYLASDWARFMTGSTVFIDGGFTAR
jgi:NAD(P)-dependent dehydrogenase (short-subunit alcohol dehydrogenase family)